MRRATWPVLLALGSALFLGPVTSISRAEEEAKPEATPEVQEPEQIHECKDASGNVIFQHDPCPKKRRASAPKDADEPAPPPKPEKKKPVMRSLKQPEASVSRPLPATEPTVQYRRPIVLPKLEPPPPVRRRDPSSPVDPRYSSPERTWKTFLAALHSGDRRAAADCLTSDA